MATNFNDKLCEIPMSEWPKLRDLFRENWPEHLLAYATIDNRIFLKKKFPAMNFQIFGLNDDWSDGTFILVDGVHRSIYTLEGNCDRLKRAMLLHDWSSGPRIAPYMSQFKSTVEDVFEQLGYEIEFHVKTVLWWLPKEEALKMELEIPDDVYLSSLKLEHLDQINGVWPHKDEGSKPYLRDILITNRTIAIFGKQENELRAWVLRLNNGFLAALQTDEHHYRKGYGALVLQAMAKAEAEEGRDTFGGIVEGNTASSKLFEKIGFKKTGAVLWIKNIPK